MNSIRNVCESLGTDSLGYWQTPGELDLGEGRDYKRSFVCLNSVKMQAGAVSDVYKYF